MAWIAPLAGLLGVIVGGMLNGALAAASARRNQRVAAAVASRLLSKELKLIGDTVDASLAAGTWGAILDPGLPYSRGLWAVEHRGGVRDESAWPPARADLAIELSDAEWDAVCRPYELIDEISLKFWTDEPDRSLDDARAYLEDLAHAVGPARAALEALHARLHRHR
jgi:hypothetical protein